LKYASSQRKKGHPVPSVCTFITHMPQMLNRALNQIWNKLKLPTLAYLVIWAGVEDLTLGPLLRSASHNRMKVAIRALNQRRLADTAPPACRHF
jgi:hypothetical protein